MIILRLALVSALIYVGFALVIEVALLILAKLAGGYIFMAPKLGWFVFFGVLWFISFWIALRFSPLFRVLSPPK